MPSRAQHVVCIPFSWQFKIKISHPFSWQFKTRSSFPTDLTSDGRNRNKAVERYATD